MSATLTERRCTRCGILASEALQQNEPICNDGGLVGGHSYADLDLSLVPGAFEHQLLRELSGGRLIEFEEAPVGWLTQAGEPRKRAYRAYYWTPGATCERCGGDGRVNGATRVKKCPECKGTGTPPRQRCISVSSMLDLILPKPGLPPWYEMHGIEGTMRAIQEGNPTLDPPVPPIPASTPPADMVRLVRAAELGAEAARDEAADRGIDIHDLLREYMETGNAPSKAGLAEADLGYHRALCKFLAKVNPEPEQVEELVAHPGAGYAGRSDLVANVGGLRVRFDAKTSEKCQIYPGAHVQVDLYERAGVAIGDEPCDLLQVAVFAADGEYDVMACATSSRAVDTALAWIEEIRPVNSACESRNRAQKEMRR